MYKVDARVVWLALDRVTLELLCKKVLSSAMMVAIIVHFVFGKSVVETRKTLSLCHLNLVKKEK